MELAGGVIRVERSWDREAGETEPNRRPKPIVCISVATPCLSFDRGGVNANALSTYTGHANIALTLDRYGHLMPGSEDEAAALLDAYLERAGADTAWSAA